MSFHNFIIMLNFLCKDGVVSIDGSSEARDHIIIRQHRTKEKKHN